MNSAEKQHVANCPDGIEIKSQQVYLFQSGSDVTTQTVVSLFS